MSNSSLVTYTAISPNRTSPRRGTIQNIVIHHMDGNLSVETCGQVFAPTSRQASSNYGVDSTGKIAMYCPEADRAWTTGSQIDHSSITIEVADDSRSPYHTSEKALAATIDLCVDICKRNGIAKLNYTGDKTGNLLQHRWFQSTSCPETYLAGKFPYIAQQVNLRLGHAVKAGWVHDSKGWWYQNADGSWPKNTWAKYDAWYYFGADGYAYQNKWQKHTDGKWYYLGNDCRMVTGWLKYKNNWYYLEPGTGAMLTGAQEINGYKYYLRPYTSAAGPEGSMLVEWHKEDDKWVNYNKSYDCQPIGSKLASHWVNSGGKKYWIKSDGYMAAGEQVEIDGTVYSFDNTGALTGEEKNND